MIDEGISLKHHNTGMEALSGDENEPLVIDEEGSSDMADEKSKFIDINEDDEEQQSHTQHSSMMITLKGIICFNWAPCLPARYILMIIGFIGLALDYALRINLSIAIIDMQV